MSYTTTLTRGQSVVMLEAQEDLSPRSMLPGIVKDNRIVARLGPCAPPWHRAMGAQIRLLLPWALLSSVIIEGERRDHTHELCNPHSFQSQPQHHPG